MSKEEYIKYITEMIEKMDNVNYLNRIFNYVQKYFVKEEKKPE